MNPRRFLRTENLLASLLLTAASTATVSAQATWNGTTSVNWSVAGNWAPGIPLDGDDITIANTTTNGLTLDGTTNRIIGSFTFGTTGTRTAAFTVSTGTNTLTINEGLSATGAFPVNTPGPTFNGNLIIGADQTWDIGGNIGSVTQDTGVYIRERSSGNLGSIVMNGDLIKSGTGQLVIAATTISGAGDFVVNNGALKLNAGASLLLTVGGTGNIQVNNSASLFVSRNSGTMAITRDIVMSGTSTMVLSGGGTTNTSTIASNMAWTGTTHTLNLSTTANTYISTGAWTGTGTVNKIGTGTITLNGSNGAFAGTLNVQAGRVNLDTNFGGAVTLATGATLAGEVTVGGPLSLNGGTLILNPLSAGALGTSGNLTLTGTTALSLTTPSSQDNFTVLTYGGTLTGTVANLSTAGITGYRNLTLSSATAGMITANTGASTRTWNGGTGVWEAGGTSTNWQEGDLKFFNADAVTFTATGAGNVAITGNLAPSSIVVNSNADYNFTSAGAANFISGTTSIVKSGTGLMTLAGANTYTGGVTINGGTLRLANGTALGANGQQITVASGATLDIAGQFNGNRDYQISIAGTGAGGIGAIYNNTGAATSGFRSVTLTGDALVGGDGRWDIRPITAGTGFLDLGGFTLTKSGNGIVAVVDSVVSNAGNIEVNGGTLAFTRSTVSGTGTVHANTGTTLRFENYTSGTFTKNIALTGSTLRLQGSNFTLGSAITLNSGTGTLDIEAARVLSIGTGIVGSGNLATLGAGTVVLTGNSSYAGTTTIGGTTTLQVGNQTATGTLGAGAITNNANLIINRSDTAYEVTNDIGGTGALTIGQAASGNLDSRVTLSGNNTFTGNVTVQSGGLVIKNSSALGTGPKTVNVNNGSAGSSQLYLDGTGGDINLASSISLNTSSSQVTRPAIGNLAGNNSINGSITLTVGGGNTVVSVQGGSLALNGGISANADGRVLVLAGNSGANGTVNGAITGGGSPPMGLEKTGANKWTLNAANTYTGNTNITGGTLELGAAGSIADSAQIIVGSTTTLDVSAKNGWTLGATQTLSGSGTIIGNTSIAGDLRPGTSPGTLNVLGDLGLIGGSDLFMELGGTSLIDFDRLVVSGDFNAGGVIQVSLVNGFTPTLGDSFDLVDFATFTDSGYTFTFTSAPLAEGLTWDTSSFDDNGSIQVVPEPSGALLLLLGMSGLLLRRRKP